MKNSSEKALHDEVARRKNEPLAKSHRLHRGQNAEVQPARSEARKQPGTDEARKRHG
jgi:hypothetical protein